MEKRSFDVIGSIAVLEIPDEMKKKEKLIAKEILEQHKNIRTVVKKSGAHKGKFRLQRMIHIAGEKTKETVHRENNISLKLNIEKVYFSPRLSTERLRIAKLVKPNEKVLVMFSGCGPYPMVISKNSEAKEIIGIELNKTAHKYAEQNLKLNKIANVRLICGDVKTETKKLGKFDRVIMPLPKGSKNFIKEALTATKKKGMIHLYDFVEESKLPEEIKAIEKLMRKHKKNFRMISFRKCGQLAPRAYRICFDLQIL